MSVLYPGASNQDKMRSFWLDSELPAFQIGERFNLELLAKVGRSSQLTKRNKSYASVPSRKPAKLSGGNGSYKWVICLNPVSVPLRRKATARKTCLSMFESGKSFRFKPISMVDYYEA